MKPSSDLKPRMIFGRLAFNDDTKARTSIECRSLTRFSDERLVTRETPVMLLATNHLLSRIKD
jgi:hypothetical protein